MFNVIINSLLIKIHFYILIYTYCRNYHYVLKKRCNVQQHSNNLSSMKYGSDHGFILNFHKRNKKSDRECIPHCLLCSSIAFFLLNKSNIVNDAPK